MICKKCNIDKPLSDFYMDKNGYIRKKCKKCVIEESCKNQQMHKDHRKQYCKEYHNKHKEERIKKDMEYREKVNALKTPCQKCGDTRLYVIDFHHIDPAEKSFNIHRKTAKTDFSLIENEVKKCVCLCRNCHMEFHYFYGMIPDNPRKALFEYLKEDKKK